MRRQKKCRPSKARCDIAMRKIMGADGHVETVFEIDMINTEGFSCGDIVLDNVAELMVLRNAVNRYVSALSDMKK